MRKEYDFSGAKRAKDVPHLAKLQARAQPNNTRVTMWADEDDVSANHPPTQLNETDAPDSTAQSTHGKKF